MFVHSWFSFPSPIILTNDVELVEHTSFCLRYTSEPDWITCIIVLCSRRRREQHPSGWQVTQQCEY